MLTAIKRKNVVAEEISVRTRSTATIGILMEEGLVGREALHHGSADGLDDPAHMIIIQWLY